MRVGKTDRSTGPVLRQAEERLRLADLRFFCPQLEQQSRCTLPITLSVDLVGSALARVNGVSPPGLVVDGVCSRDSHTQNLGRTQAVALSISANLFEGARSLLISGVLVRLYIRDFYLVLLGLFGIRDEDED